MERKTSRELDEVAALNDTVAEKDDTFTTFEDILHVVKPIGPFQFYVYFLLQFINFFAGLINSGIGFLQITPTFECTQHSLSNSSRLGNCHNENGSACSEWIFYPDSSTMRTTIVTEWSLVCEQKLLGQHAHMVYMVGMAVAALATGRCSDKFGRKTVLLFSSTGLAVNATIMSYSPTYAMFIVFRFFTGICTGFTFTPMFTLGMEVTSAKYRSILGGAWWLPYSLGCTAVAIVAYGTREWRVMGLISAAPLFLTVFYYWLLPESPRWLLVNNRLAQAESVLRLAARLNGAKLPKNIDFARIAKNINEMEERKKESNIGCLTIIKHPLLLGRSLICTYSWMCNGLCAYGLFLFAIRLPGSAFLVVGLIALSQIPGAIVAGTALVFVPRRISYFTAATLAGLSLIILAWLPADGVDWLIVTLAFVGKAGVVTSWSVLYLYTTEVFPTVMRNTALSNSAIGSGIGSIVAPYIAAVHKLDPNLYWLPPVIFAAAILPTALLIFLLPETMGRKLPDHLEDMAKSTKSADNFDYDDE